jgi:hypothetical protein
MALRLAKEADRLYLEEHVRHGSRENRRLERERVHTFLDWVEINIKGVTNLRRLGKNHVIKFWQAYSHLSDKTAYEYWLSIDRLSKEILLDFPNGDFREVPKPLSQNDRVVFRKQRAIRFFGYRMAHQSRIRDNAGDAIKAARNWLAGNVSPEQRDITDRELWILFNCDKQAIEKLQAGEFDGVSAGTLLAILNHLKIRFVSEQDLTVLTSEILQKTND